MKYCSFDEKTKAAFDLGGQDMAYSIGDVSRVLGITASALHYYE